MGLEQHGLINVINDNILILEWKNFLLLLFLTKTSPPIMHFWFEKYYSVNLTISWNTQMWKKFAILIKAVKSFAFW